MSTNSKVSSVVAEGTSRKWLVPVLLGLSLMLIAAVVIVALSLAAGSATTSGIGAELDASSAAPGVESDPATLSAATSDSNMTAEERYLNVLERYESGALEYHAPGR